MPACVRWSASDDSRQRRPVTRPRNVGRDGRSMMCRNGHRQRSCSCVAIGVAGSVKSLVIALLPT